MKQLQVAALFSAFLISVGSPTHGSELKDELLEHVIDPCFLYGIRKEGLGEMMGGDDEALALMKIMQTSAVENMVNAIAPLVANQDAATRKTLYAVFLQQCIAGMTGGQGTRSASSVAVEPDAIFGPKFEEVENRQAVLDDLAGRIRKAGWKCDSISAASMFVFSRGFSVSCNRYAYQYEIEDKGGNWVVTLD